MGADATKYPIVIAHRYNIENCKKNQTVLFVFGDNEERSGRGGQAIIREEKNAIGIATKASIREFWSDKHLDMNKQSIDADIQRVEDYFKGDPYFKAICFPKGGLGTGLSNLHIEAPKTFLYLCEALFGVFGYNNLMGLKSE